MLDLDDQYTLDQLSLEGIASYLVFRICMDKGLSADQVKEASQQLRKLVDMPDVEREEA